jgi:carboxyl-terminal processing protease
MTNKKFFLPVIIVLIIVGIFIGMKIQVAVSDDKLSAQVKKFSDALTITTRYYVDEVDSQKLTEAAIEGMLKKLDPHSVYITAEQLKRVNEDFQGSFEGIGIEFDIINDTLTVVSPIAGGPSEKLGIQAGDKIISIDGVSAIKIDREEVPKKLKGPKGTKVNVTIKRAGLTQPMDFEIIRDKIPIYSVDASFMHDDDIGYIKVSRFSATTYDEFMQAATDLKSKGMEKLVLDLRGNPGGYLDQAFKMGNEFIPEGQKIVFTKSRIDNFNEDYISQGGRFTDIPLVVLVNGGSASASEIVSGAVQDWDRGLVVGETTFGKGLVQRQFDLPDGSAFRVTTARYYTPVGRLIQKPYEEGSYAGMLRDEAEGDNFDHQIDSKDTTREKFKTFGGRTVLGGGGITPDYIVKMDTLTSYTVQLRRLNLLYRFAERYMSANRSSIESRYKDFYDFRKNYIVDEKMLSELKVMAEVEGILTDNYSFNKDIDFIKTSIKFQIARDIWGNTGSYAVWVMNDDQFLKAITLFDDAQRLAKLKN